MYVTAKDMPALAALATPALEGPHMTALERLLIAVQAERAIVNRGVKGNQLAAA